jgi:UrcA family protein
MQYVAVGVFTAALALATPTPATAQPAQIEVNLSGIDLTSDAGADRALRRIRNAARAVCGVRGGAQPYRDRADARDCAREAMRRGVEDLNSPHVSRRLQRSRTYAETARRS